MWHLDPFAQSEMDGTDMEHASEVTLTYSSTRHELAMWYWRIWKKKLWKVHIVYLVVSLTIVVLAAGHWPPSAMEIMRGLVVGAAVVLFLILLPQIMFKPQVRTLVLDRNGVRTKIGKKTANISWQEIESISDTEGTIAISRKNLNAFLVPQRAFQSEQERASVLTAVRAWMGLTRQ
jgi:hypothetical protein